MKHMHHRHPNQSRDGRQKGQALISFVLAAGLLALAVAGIMHYVGQGHAATSSTTATNNLSTIVNNAQSLYHSDPSAYANITTQALIQNGAVPTSMVSGTTLISNFGTPVTVTPSTCYNSDDCADFTYQVPQENCSKFTQNVSDLFVKISVGGTLVKDSTSGLALAPATLGSQCASSSGGNVQVVFTASR